MSPRGSTPKTVRYSAFKLSGEHVDGNLTLGEDLAVCALSTERLGRRSPSANANSACALVHLAHPALLPCYSATERVPLPLTVAGRVGRAPCLRRIRRGDRVLSPAVPPSTADYLSRVPITSE